MLAAPASADPHANDGPANHTATSASQERNESVGGSSQRSRPDGVDNLGKVATDPSVGEPATAAEPDTANPEASEVWLPGHDKCKRRRGLRLLPLWCTDPAAVGLAVLPIGTQNNPGKPNGICDASSSLHPASRCSPVRTAAAAMQSLRRPDPGRASRIVQRSMISESAVTGCGRERRHHPAGMNSGHLSRSMRTSYTEAGGAVDGCSTLIDTEVGMTWESIATVRVARRICERRGRTATGTLGHEG